jgi:phage shock protein A
MTESIFVRVQRVVSGGVGSAVDLAEQLSGTSLMRQAIRDMHNAMSRTRDEADEALTRRLQAEHQLASQRKHLATLKEQARFALASGREDLAQVAIGRQIDVERQIERLAKLQADSKAEEAKLQESLTALKLRAAEMEDQLAAFRAAQAAANAAEDSPGRANIRAERKAERAEEAFDRAMKAAGGIAGERATPEAAAKVAEIETLQREAAIAERLAALRTANTAPAPSGAGKRPVRSKPGKA